MATGNKVECGACMRPTPRGIKCLYCGALLVAEVECAGCQRRFGAHITQCLYCGTKRAATVDLGAAARPAEPPPPSWNEWAKQLARAAKAVDEGRHTEALQLLEPILEARPDDVDALVLRGDALRRLGRYEAALHALRRAAELAPELAICWYALAHLELEIDLRPEALVSLLTCLLRLPHAPGPQRAGMAAMLRRYLGQLEPALAAAIEPYLAQGELGVVWAPEEARWLGAKLAAARQRLRPA